MGQRITLLVLIVCICSACLRFAFPCSEAERRALLKFKHSFIDESNRLGSWVGEGCCDWKGVGCDNVTGNVIMLDLGSELYPSYPHLEAGEVNPALLELKYLKYLNLSFVDFNGSRIPEFFGSMRQLEYLNLSNAYFNGKVPHNLGNLTDLVVLDLSASDWLGNIEANNLEWAFGLEKLQYLDLSQVNLTQPRETLSLLHHLPSLSVLNLAYCELGNSHLVTTRNSTISSSTLQHLDLKGNFFSGPIPPFLHNLSYIRFLDLSYNHFNSSIPSWLGNKGNLCYLSLGQNYFNGLFPRSIQNLSSLTSLDLSENQFSSSIPLWLANKTYLEYLSLRFNNFNRVDGGIMSIIGHLCRLKYLDLSINQLQEEVFESYVNFPWCSRYDLEYLYMQNNKISGYLPILGNLSSLQALDLSNNNLETLPPSMGGLSSLDYLDLSYNIFKVLAPVIGNLSSLQVLDLSYNNLETLPPSLGRLLSLHNLDLSYNNLKVLSPTIGSLSSLQVLDLSNTNLETLPPSLGRLPSLIYLNLSYNNLTLAPQVSLANLSSLRNLDISSNYAILDLSPDWVPPFQLDSLRIKDCKLNSPIPKWILSQEQISKLDLSNSGIFGPLLDSIGNAMPSLQSILLVNNQINGSIPRSLCELGGLEILDLRKNRLSGIIPDFWENSGILSVELSSNKISGHIPHSLGKVINLQFLRLNNNSIEGELPLSLSNSTYLEFLDVGRNNLHGEIPPWINGSNFPHLDFLILRENRFNGSIPQQLCSVYSLQIIDFARNNLSGTIPQCFGHFQGMGSPSTSFIRKLQNSSTWSCPMYSKCRLDLPQEIWSAVEVIKGEEREYTTILNLLVNMDLSCNHLVGLIPAEIVNLSFLLGLNLSNNHLNGTIPKEIGKMRSLESLDLSSNNLSGSIPESISSLDYLSDLNLSFNNLQGRIPTSRHLQTLNDSSIYMGNPGLCGDPLPKKCFRYDIAHPPTRMFVEDGDNKQEMMRFYMVIMLGFATEFWGVIGTLVVHKKWRHACFRIAEEIADWIYVSVAVRIARANRGR